MYSLLMIVELVLMLQNFSLEEVLDFFLEPPGVGQDPVRDIYFTFFFKVCGFVTFVDFYKTSRHFMECVAISGELNNNSHDYTEIQFDKALSRIP